MADKDKAEATQPRDINKELAEVATGWLDKDRVTRAQAAVYRDLLGPEPFGEGGLLEGVDPEKAKRWSTKVEPTDPAVRDRLREAYSHLKPSHQWLKAVIATAVAIEENPEFRPEG